MNLVTRIMSVFVMATAVAGSSQAATLFFDFGAGDQTTPGNYNNIITSVPQTLTITNAIDSTGAATEIDLTIERFSVGADTSGTTTPVGAAAIFDPQATRDSAFGRAGEFSSPSDLDFQDLDPDLVYELTFFASRIGTSDNLETKFTVLGRGTTDILFLDAGNNTSNVALVSNIRPSVSGSIHVNVEPGPNNTSGERLFYLGALRLVSVPEPMTSNLLVIGALLVSLNRRSRRRI